MNDPVDETFRRIHEEFESRAAALAADGRAKSLWMKGKDLTRDQWRDEQTRWAFWRASTRNCQADQMSSDEWLFTQAIWGVIDAARDDERKRIMKIISEGLKKLLGEEFREFIYDIAYENDINTGYDW